MISIFLILILLAQENTMFQEMRENLRKNLGIVTPKTHSELKREIEKKISESRKFIEGLFPIINPPKEQIEIISDLMGLQPITVLIIERNLLDVSKAIKHSFTSINYEEQIKIIREVPKNVEEKIKKKISESKKFVEKFDIHDRSKELIKINLATLEDQLQAVAKTYLMNSYQLFISIISQEKINKIPPILDALRESQPFYITQHDEL